MNETDAFVSVQNHVQGVTTELAGVEIERQALENCLTSVRVDERDAGEMCG